MTEVLRCLWAALVLVRTQPKAALRELEGLRGGTVDPRLRSKLWPALAALRNGRRVDAEGWIRRALKYHEARRSGRNEGS
jgi:hypothetical protein